MAVGCTNGLPFTVLEGQQAEDTGLEVWIYSQDDPTSNPIGVLDNARSKAFLRELAGPGSGEFEVGVDDEDVAGDVLKTGNLASMVLRQIKQKTFVISEFDAVEVDDTEEAGRWTRVSGEGEESLLRQIVVYPEVPYADTKATKRLFTYVSFDYDDSDWTPAISLKVQSANGDRYNGYPILWPDQDAEWIWSSYSEPGSPAPVGISYFRKEFTLTEPTMLHFFATCDDVFEMHLDGQFLMAGGGVKEWRRPYGKSVIVPPGTHLIAVRAENITRPPDVAHDNIAGFICTVLAETGTSGTAEQQKIYVEATGGDFTLTFRSEETNPIAWPPDIADVQAKLEGLDAIDEVIVGAVESANSFELTVVFSGPVVNYTDQPMIEINYDNLTGVVGTPYVEESFKGGSAQVLLHTDSSWLALDYPVIPPAMTPGAVMLACLGEGTARGSKVAPYFTPGFTADVDSKGQLWADPNEASDALVVDMEFNVGDTVLDVLNKLREMGVEAEVDPNFTLRMWRKKGVDRSLHLDESPSISLRPAHNITGLSREKAGLPTNTLLVRAREAYVEKTHASSATAYGRREGFLSLGDTLSTPMLNRQVALAFATTANPVDNVVIGTAGIDPHRPLEDFVSGDYVRLYAYDGTWDKIRVLSIAVAELDDGSIGYETEVGVPKLEVAQRLERWLYVATNGTLRGTLYSAEGVSSSGESYSSFINPPLIDEAGGGLAEIPYATSVQAQTTFGKTASVGSSEKVARQDHSHGTPADPVPAHNTNDDAHDGDLLRARGGGRGQVRVASVSGAVGVNLDDGNDHVLTVTGDVTAVTLSGAVAGRLCSVTVQWVQDGTGGHAIANPAGVTWLGTEPEALTDPDAVTLLAFWTADGGTTWYGAAAGSGGGSPGYSEMVGDGSTTSFVVAHGLATSNVIVQVHDLEATPPVVVLPDEIEVTDDNNVTVTFLPAPAVDGRRILVKAV